MLPGTLGFIADTDEEAHAAFFPGRQYMFSKISARVQCPESVIIGRRVLYLWQVLDIEPAWIAALHRHALGQVQLDRDIDCLMAVEVNFERDAMLASLPVGDDVELVDFEPGDRGHHDGVVGVVGHGWVELEAVFEGQRGWSPRCLRRQRSAGGQNRAAARGWVQPVLAGASYLVCIW